MTCPDGRLESQRDALAKDNKGGAEETIFLSSAGGNVRARFKSIAAIEKAYGSVSILAVIHSGPGGQCGGLSVVEDELKRGIVLSDETSEALTSQFRGIDYKDREELERKINENAQRQNMKRFRSSEGSIMLVETMPDPHPGERTLLIGRPTAGSDSDAIRALGKDPKHTYPVRAFFLDEIAADLPIFLVKMGMKYVIIIPETNVERLKDIGPMPEEFESRVREMIRRISTDVKIVSQSEPEQ